MRNASRLFALAAALTLAAIPAAGGTAAGAGVVAAPPPASTNDSYDAYEDHVLTVQAPGVLGNDDGSGSTPCVLSADDTGLDGTVKVEEDGSFVFTPLDDYVGTTTFTYDMGVLTDSTCGGDPSEATVSIKVASVNDPPTAILDADCTGGVSVAEDSGPYSVADHCAAVASFGTVEEAGQTVSAWVVTNNNNALFSVQPSLVVSGSIYGDLRFTPAANAFGSATVSLKARDSGGTANDGVNLSAAITFTLTVTSVNDAPTAAADSFIVLKDRTLLVGVPGVLINDADIDSPSLSAELVSGPSHGVLFLLANGSFSYTPAAGYEGPDAFSYRASDGSLVNTYSPTRVVSLTVTSVPPVNTPTPFPTPSGTPLATPSETFVEPSPSASADASASIDPFASASPIPSPLASALASPSASAPPDPGPTGDGGGISLPVLLVLVLFVLLVGFGAAVYVPKWLAAQRTDGPIDPD